MLNLVHQLDVYYPTVEGTKVPILFFEYGGGFSSGSRVLPPANIVYRNVGAFFARKGYVLGSGLRIRHGPYSYDAHLIDSILTVIADYRLVPEAKFPDGAEDIKDAVAWIVGHADEVTKGTNVQINTNQIFLFGHSAGASHVITTHLVPGLFPPELRSHVKGLIMNGAPYTFRPELLPPGPGLPVEVMVQYYGGEEALVEKEPYTLLKNAPEEILSSFPPSIIAWAEKEPDALEQMNKVFVKLAKEKLPNTEIVEHVLKGHNHVSSSMALSSGEGEEWGDFVAEWIKAKTA